MKYDKRHPVENVGDKRICPNTDKQFKESWSTSGTFTHCEQCDPDGYIPVGTRLARLNEKYKRETLKRATGG